MYFLSFYIPTIPDGLENLSLSKNSVGGRRLLNLSFFSRVKSERRSGEMGRAFITDSGFIKVAGILDEDAEEEDMLKMRMGDSKRLVGYNFLAVSKDAQ